MSVLDFFSEPVNEHDDEQTRMIAKLMGTYFKYQMLDKLAGAGIDMVRGKRDLADQNAALDIQMKRRALGLPFDDDLYEESLREDKPLRTKGAVAAFGKRASELVPEPGFLKPKPHLPFASHVSGGRMPLFETRLTKDLATEIVLKGAPYARSVARRGFFIP